MLMSHIGFRVAFATITASQAPLRPGFAPQQIQTTVVVNESSAAEQARGKRLGRITAVVQISSHCCSAPAAWERVRHLQSEYCDQDVDILVRGTESSDTFQTLIDEYLPEWPPTTDAPARSFTLSNDGAFRGGPGNCLLFGRNGYLIAADFHSSELELRLLAACNQLTK